MKFKHIFFASLFAAIIFSGCDKISQPLVSEQQNGVLPHTSPTYRDSSATSGPASYLQYKVLLEDCMGHLCSNCPPAVYAGDALIAASNPLSSHIVLIEENMGHYADVTTIQGLPDSAFSKDYSCVAGNAWLTQFNITLFPWGMVDRSNAPNNLFVIYSNWQDTVQQLVTNNPTPSVTINIHDSCWVPQRIIGATFQVTFQKAFPANNNYLLEAVIIQDSIYDWQADGNSNDNNFLHREVLRGAFDVNGKGYQIPQSVSSTVNGTWTAFKTYDFLKGEDGKAAGWNMAHCYIVAFVYGSSSNAKAPDQVLQAEMIKVE